MSTSEPPRVNGDGEIVGEGCAGCGSFTFGVLLGLDKCTNCQGLDEQLGADDE